MKTLFLLVLVLTWVSFSSTMAQTRDRELLEWNEYYSLTWEDYQGKPGKEAIGDAGTAVQISAKPYEVKDKIYYDVIAYFSRKNSWSREQSEELLKHEQLHFDIAELYARKIRKRILDMDKQGVKDIKVYNSQIRELLEESNAEDERYDLETLHGALTKKQALWQKKVASQLEELQEYKRSKRVISVGERLKKQPTIHDRG